MMHYQLDKQRRESAYMQIYRQLREEIISGTLKAGTKLPSKRALAEELNVSVITVEHAYALLIDEGYVLSKPRSGLYAAFGSCTICQKGQPGRYARNAVRCRRFPFFSLGKDDAQRPF